MPHLTLPEIESALSPFGVKLSEPQLSAISTYVDVLLFWNEKINLTAITDPVEIVVRHFGESIFATSLLPLSIGRLADVGTGAGFPGLPIKIVCPELGVLLIESNSKKCVFLREVITELGLPNVDVSKSHYEAGAIEPRSCDFICAKALGDYKRLLRWSENILNSSGRIILWLGTDESTSIGRATKWRWKIPAPMPESRRRVILIGKSPV